MQLTSKILAFYFLIGSFLPKTDFSQLTKIPELMEHYELYQLEVLFEKRKYNFWEFLYDHFISLEDHTHHEESDTHNDLPFKIIIKVAYNSISGSLTINWLFSFNRIIAFPEFRNSLHLQEFIRIFFHPPAA